MSGSEDGEILFWDARSKEIAQRVNGHEGVVCWIDASPGLSGMVVSGGMDGTVRIWVDVDEDDEGVGGIDGLKLEHENGECGFDHDGDDVDMVKVENDDGYDDIPMNGGAGERTPEREASPDKMDENSA